MSELKNGDIVRIKRLEDVKKCGRTGWVSSVMDKYAGTVLTVTKVDEIRSFGTYVSVDECNWVFHVDWIDHSTAPITVPVDPSCVPAGYRAVRVGVPKKGETSLDFRERETFNWEKSSQGSIRLILEKIPEPIVLPDWIPAGWWIAKDSGGDIYVYFNEPKLSDFGWANEECGDLLYLRELRDTLPKAYLDLLWKESLMQKTEVKG